MSPYGQVSLTAERCPVPRGGRRGHSEYSSTIRANRRCESRIVSEVASKQLAIHLTVIWGARQAGSGIIRGVASNKPGVRLDVNLKSRPREMGTLRNVILESCHLPGADARRVGSRAGPAGPHSFEGWGRECAANPSGKRHLPSWAHHDRGASGPAAARARGTMASSMAGVTRPVHLF